MTIYEENVMTVPGPVDEATLQAIEQRTNAATEGPWCADPFDDDDDGWFVHASRPDALDGFAVIVATAGSGSFSIEPTNREADAEFIAHARTDVPLLTAAVRTLQAERDEWHEEFDSLFENHQALGADLVIEGNRRDAAEALLAEVEAERDAATKALSLDRVYDALHEAQYGGSSVSAEEREACAQLAEAFVAALAAAPPQPPAEPVDVYTGMDAPNGEPLMAVPHCSSCLRPLPHTASETEACGQATTGEQR